MLFFFLIIQCFGMAGQSTYNKNMQLEEIIGDPRAVRTLVEANFDNFYAGTKDAMDMAHPLSIYQLNKVFKKQETNYCLFQIPVNAMYAFIPPADTNAFCLYLLIGLGKDEVNALVTGLGKPVNIPFEDVESDDFDFLHWMEKGLDITLFPSILYDESLDAPSRRNKQAFLVITNMDYNDIVNKEPMLGVPR